MRVGFLGAFSIDNTGDVLVGRATRQAVHARMACEEVVFGLDLPGRGWRHDWTGIEKATGEIAGVDALVIGGGGLLIPELPRVVSWGEGRAAWNAVCSQGTPRFDPSRAAWYAQVAAACDRLAYVSVRNQTTERLLRSCGFTGHVAQVPDPAIGFTCPPPAPIDRKTPGVPLVGLSVGNALANPRAAQFFEGLFAELRTLSSRGAIELLVFPFGRVYGDTELAQRASSRLAGARLMPSGLSPEETWQLIGQLDLHICARLHAMLAAYAQRIPFLVCDEYLSDTTATSKIRDFIVDRELEASYLSPWLANSPEGRLRIALADLDRVRPPAARLAADHVALAQHFDRLVAALNLKPA